MTSADDLLALTPAGSLVQGARNAIETCLGVKAGERFLVIADVQSLEIAAALVHEAVRAGAVPSVCVLEEHVTRPSTVAPALAIDQLSRAEAAVYCARPHAGELPHRAAIIDAVELHGVRYGHMVGITRDIMAQAMRADYVEVDAISRKVQTLCSTAREVRVTSPAGTDFSVKLDARYRWVKTSGLITREIWGNLPGGEVFTVPADAEGVFMCDATLGDDFYDRFGDLQRTPLKIEISNGYLVRATSENKAVAKAFEQYCTVAENSDRVGEFAFGTNVALRDTIGNLLQDEKIPGVHIAFGRTCPTQTGATWDAKTHIDVIARDCDAWVDGLKIMERGRYLI